MIITNRICNTMNVVFLIFIMTNVVAENDIEIQKRVSKNTDTLFLPFKNNEFPKKLLRI